MNTENHEEQALDALIHATLFPEKSLTELDKAIINEVSSADISLSDIDKSILDRLDKKLDRLIAGIEYVDEVTPVGSVGSVSMAMNRGFQENVLDAESEEALKKKREELLKKIRDSKNNSNNNEKSS